MTDLETSLLDTRTVYDGGSPTLTKAAAEIARLRKALQQIADFQPKPSDWLPHEQIAVFAKDTARAALAQAR